MNWNEGYTASYYLTIVDPASWRDQAMVDITGGTINKTADSLMESGSVELTEPLGETWVRVYLDARQGAGGERTPVFTGLLQIPEKQWDGNVGRYTGDLYSVLKAVDDILLPRGWYALVGQNGAQVAANLLSVGPAPVSYAENAPELMTNIIAEDGETYLTMARRIVEAIGWRIRINGNGEIEIVPQANKPQIRLDTQTNDIVEPSISDKLDLYSVPNVFMAVSGDQSAIARNEAAIEERGREVWAGKFNVKLNSGESITQYAERMLDQAPVRTIKYARRYRPDVYPGDIASLDFPAQSIFGDYTIKKQRISLEYGAPVDEEVYGYAVRETETSPRRFYFETDQEELFISSNDELFIGERNA